MNHKRGFTLLELLIAISIFSVIMIGIYPAFSQVIYFNQENYIRTSLMDNLRAGMDRISRELREATWVNLNNDEESNGYIIFSKTDPNDPTGSETIKYELTNSSYTIQFFPEGKEIKRYIWNNQTNSWEGGNPVTEPAVYSLKFKRSGQIIRIEIISKIILRPGKLPQDYIYITNIAVRNPL
ncbi:MAG: prepilin-type N-terminal cleavage/methylation domain-containing protein [Nitrososphaerota archaeon]